MRQTLTFLVTCLLLVCCEKQPNSHGRAVDSVPAKRTLHQGNGRRASTQIPNAPDTFQEKLAAAAGIKVSEDRSKAIAEVAWNAFEINPELANKAFLMLSEGSLERIRLIQHYAMRLTEQNYDEAIAWASALASDLERATALSQIALTLAESDPLAAANLISESGIVGREFDVAVVQIVQRWAAKSPPHAAAWVAGFPPGLARQTAIKCIAARWLHSDASAVFSWLTSLEDSGIRAEAALGLEEAILQQPQGVTVTWLQHAGAPILSELEQHRHQALANVGDNIPPP